MLRLSLPRLVALVAAITCLPLALWAASPLVGEGAQTPESLQKSIDGRKAREHALSTSAQRLAGLESALARDVSVLQGRLSSVQADLSSEEARLGTTQVDLRGERARSQRLAQRLAHGRVLLARRLREQYTASEPDLVTVILSAQNLPDLLEQTEFLRRIQRSDERIVTDVRDARDASRVQAKRSSRCAAARPRCRR
jgi:peptidoglycan hydrolase CwlO-like protein